MLSISTIGITNQNCRPRAIAKNTNQQPQMKINSAQAQDSVSFGRILDANEADLLISQIKHAKEIFTNIFSENYGKRKSINGCSLACDQEVTKKALAQQLNCKTDELPQKIEKMPLEEQLDVLKQIKDKVNLLAFREGGM